MMKRKKWVITAAVVFAAVCVGLLVGIGKDGLWSIVLAPANGKQPVGDEYSNLIPSSSYQVQGVSYPKKAADEDDDLEPGKSDLKGLQAFYQKTMEDVLTRDKKSVAYSPINLYLCMAMLTEMTSGSTQEQLLDALGQKSTSEVREQSQNIWKGVYAKDDISKCILGNSIWLNERIPYNKDVLKILSKNYYASSHQGKMGTATMDESMQDWVNSLTGDALTDQAKGIRSSGDSALILLSSAYFYDQWSDPFSEENTKEGKFHCADGSTEKCEMMKQVNLSSYYQEERFSSTTLFFEKGKEMNIFLPAEGTTIEQMLQEDMEEILHICSGTSKKKSEWGEVTLYLPKFEILTSNLDLIPAIKKIGVEDIFQSGVADFSRLLGEASTELEVYLDMAEQSTRVAVDENGCSVASFTEMELRCGSAMPEKECTIKCDRPFLFVISDGRSGIPVFAGVVNEMAG